MAASTTNGPLDPRPDDRETALASRWRRMRDGVPPALFLLACAVVLILVLTGIGWVLSHVVQNDAIGDADTGISRWFARERTSELNDVTSLTSNIGGTLTVTVLRVLSVG